MSENMIWASLRDSYLQGFERAMLVKQMAVADEVGDQNAKHRQRRQEEGGAKAVPVVVVVVVVVVGAVAVAAAIAVAVAVIVAR